MTSKWNHSHVKLGLNAKLSFFFLFIRQLLLNINICLASSCRGLFIYDNICLNLDIKLSWALLLSPIWVLLNDCCIHLIQKSWRNKKKRLWISQVYTIDNSKLDHLSKANFRVETKSSLMLNTRVHVGGETITYVLELMEEDDWDRIYSLNLLANMAPSTSNIIHGRVTGVQEQWKCSLQTSGSTDKRLNACPRVLALFLVEILTHLHGLHSWELL